VVKDPNGEEAAGLSRQKKTEPKAAAVEEMGRTGLRAVYSETPPLTLPPSRKCNLFMWVYTCLASLTFESKKFWSFSVCLTVLIYKY